MAEHCCGPKVTKEQVSPAYRRVLVFALVANAAMFIVEIAAGVQASSVSLLADAIDFFGDAANYGISLAVLGMASHWRSRASMFKSFCMAAFALFVAGRAAWSLLFGDVPDAAVMGAVGLLALATNLAVAAALFRWRTGDSNMRSVWLCTRNDAIGNLAVLAAAVGVFGTGTAWPDLLVAGMMASLGFAASWSVFRQARNELATSHVPAR
jgi:Co/Zn/Cd efflux system component